MAEVKVKNDMSVWHLIAGVLMTFLGVYMWFNPMATLEALALWVGVVFIAIGAGYLMMSFSFQSGWYLTVGSLDVLVGIIFVANLGVSAISFPIIFAIWSMAVGVVQLVSAFEFKKLQMPWPWLMLMGALGIVFGFLILAFPVIGALTITILMGTYVALYGLVEIAEFLTNRKYM